MPTQPPSFTSTAQAATGTAGGFAGTGVSSYSVLGITSTQATQRVTVQAAGTLPTGAIRDTLVSQAQQAGATASGMTTATVADLLSQFNTLIVSDPAQASTVAQQLYDAGLMSSAVYNGGTVANSDIYNAYKKAVLGAAASGKALGDYIVGAGNAFQAAGGPKVKLPNVRYTATLTSAEDVQSAGDAVFEKILGRRMTATELASIHSTLNNAEMSARAAEANSAYSQLLGYRGLNPDGTQINADTAAASTGATTGAAAPATVGGAANLPQQVTNSTTGATSTVTQGPIVVPYQQPPTPSASAYSYAMTNDQPEVQGRTVAAAMNAIAQFIGQK